VPTNALSSKMWVSGFKSVVSALPGRDYILEETKPRQLSSS
jgi:hypothetical protein